MLTFSNPSKVFGAQYTLQSLISPGFRTCCEGREQGRVLTTPLPPPLGFSLNYVLALSFKIVVSSSFLIIWPHERPGGGPLQDSRR